MFRTFWVLAMALISYSAFGADVKVDDEESTTATNVFTISVSPDKKLEIVELRTEDFPVRYGERSFDGFSVLYLRFRNSVNGIFLGNYKYFDVDWTPDSKYVAINKHYLTHNSDLDIYRVDVKGMKSIKLSLIFQKNALQLPAGKSRVSWDLIDWDMKKRTATVYEIDRNPNGGEPKLHIVPLDSKPLMVMEYRQNVMDRSSGLPIHAQNAPRR